MPVGLAYLKEKKQILITDTDAGLIRIIDIDGNYLNSINPDNLLEKPAAIFISDQKEIYIQEMLLEKVFVFDSEFRYLRVFGDERLQTPFNMIVDDETELVYLSTYLNNLITIWNGKTCEFIKEFSLNSPLSLSIVSDKLFVVSAIDIELFTLKYSVDISENNNNCIYVIDKNTLEILKMISISRFIHPKGLVVDDKMNFIFAALDLHSINEDKIENSKPSKYLIKLNENGEFLQKTKLGLSGTFQVLFVEKKIFFTRGFRTPPLYMIEFK
jgi:DNA-binding beta-propeller fold protein YncE